MFRNADESHQHSLQILNQLGKYEDFMLSIKTLADIGCGSGKDLEWWATRTTSDDRATPLNISCQGIDILDNLAIAKQYPNITYQQADFETMLHPPPNRFDVLWCHDAFQYAINPIQTLINWRTISSDGAMLALAVPQTTNVHHKDLDFSQQDGCYYHHTIVSLIHMLALTGWDCRTGFFKVDPVDNWIYAIVYKSEVEPMFPKKARWYDLAEAKLLPDSAEKSVMARGFLHQRDLVLPWLDKSLQWLGAQ